MKKIQEQLTQRAGDQPVPVLRPGRFNIPDLPRIHNMEPYRSGSFTGVGTLIEQLGPIAYDLIETQELSPSGVAVIHGIASTRGDGNRLQSIQSARPAERRSRLRWYTPFISQLKPNSPVVMAGSAGEGRYDGNFSNQLTAIRRLQTDPLLRDELKEAAARQAAVLRSHGLGSFVPVLPKGFGGTDPWSDYFERQLLSSIGADRSIELRVMPAGDERNLQQNAAGQLFFRLATETVPEKHIVVVFAQSRRGSHETDPALVSGLLMLTGNDHSIPSNPDAANIFGNLRDDMCGWIEVRPRVVRIPLDHLEAGFMWWKRRFSKPSSDGSTGLHYVLNAVKDLFDEDPESRHVVTCTGLWWGRDVERLRESILNLAPVGGALPVFGSMWPKVEGGCALFHIVDFVTSPTLPPLVTNLIRRTPVVARRGGIEPGDVADAFAPPDGTRQAEEIQVALDRLSPPAG